MGNICFKGNENLDNINIDMSKYKMQKLCFIENSQDRQSKKKNVIIYGFLQKRSKYIHLWKTRFFILTQNYLFAFTGVENDADCTMALDLISIESVSEILSENKTKKEFVVKTLGGDYYLRAENDNIMKKWKDEIEKAYKSKKHELQKNEYRSNKSNGVF